MGVYSLKENREKITIIIVCYEVIFCIQVLLHLFVSLRWNTWPDFLFYRVEPMPLTQLQFYSIIGLIFIHSTAATTGVYVVLGSMEGNPAFIHLWTKTISLATVPTAYAIMVNQGIGSPYFENYFCAMMIFSAIQIFSIWTVWDYAKDLEESSDEETCFRT